MFAFPLLTLAITRSPALTAIVAIFQEAGTIVGMVPGGILGDRVDRKKMLVYSGLIGIALAALITIAIANHSASFGILAAFGFLDQLRASVLGSAGGMMLRQVVPDRLLPRAAAVNEGRSAAIQLLGAPLGGLLLGVGKAVPFIFLIVMRVLYTTFALWMRGSYRPREVESRATTIREDLIEGFRWLLRRRIRLQSVFISMLMTLATSGLLMTVNLSLALQKVPAVQIGFIDSAYGAAVLIGALFAGRLVEKVGAGKVAVTQLSILSIGGIGLAFCHNYWLILIIIPMMAIGFPTLNAAVDGFFVLITPIDMQGREQAILGLTYTLIFPLAPAIAGVGLQWAGASVTLLSFAAIAALATFVVFVSRDFRRIPKSSQWANYARRKGWIA